MAVGLEGFLPSDAQIFVILSDAAWVGVLEDRHGRADEVEDQVGCSLDVEDVGVAEFLALDLGEEVGEVAVERALLVRIVAVAQFLFQRQAEGEIAARARAALAEVVGDGGVVLGRAEKHFDGQLFAEALGGVTFVLLHLLDHPWVVSGIDDHRDAGVVFGRAAQHRWAADVDFLDRFCQRDVRLGDGFFERIEIHHHQIDRWNVIGLGLGDVRRIVAALQQSAVDFRVQGLQAAVEKLGRTRELGDVDHGQACLAQGHRGAAGGEQFHSHFVEFLGKFGQAGFIRDREKSAGDRHKKGRSRS